MRNLPINQTLLVSDELIQYVNVPSMYDGFTDVMYQGNRIAILNGLSAPLQWTAKNGSNVPVNIIVKIEEAVKLAIINTYN